MVAGEEGIAYADMDLNDCIEPKQIHDVVGYYQRWDVFNLKVNRRRQGPENAFLAENQTEHLQSPRQEESSPRERSEPVSEGFSHGVGGLRLM